MEIKKTELCVSTDELDVHGNGCLDDCTGGVYASLPYKNPDYLGYYRYATRVRCGSPNAYVSYWY